MTELEKVLTEIARDLETVEKKINTLESFTDKDLSLFKGQILGLNTCYTKLKNLDNFINNVRWLNHMTKDFTNYDLGELNE